MEWRLGVPIGLLLGGVVAILWAATHGGATVYLVLIFPVIAGGSLLFLLGVLLLVVGVFALPFAAYEVEEESLAGPTSDQRSSGTGGIILLGPIPIFLGTWKSLPHRTRWLAAIAGAILFVIAIGAVLYVVR